jgi:hypothetical protein
MKELATITWHGNRWNLIDPDGYKVGVARNEELRDLLREAEMMEYQIDWEKSDLKEDFCNFDLR